MLRETMNLNHEDVASYLGISKEMVSCYESGAMNIPLKNLERISDLFQIGIDCLLEEINDVPNANVAFAFRTIVLFPETMQAIAEFNRIVRNYKTIRNLWNESGC